jgi:hypothetical protein
MNQQTEIRIDETATDVRSGFREVNQHLRNIEALLSQIIERLDRKRGAAIPPASNVIITQLPKPMTPPIRLDLPPHAE